MRLNLVQIKTRSGYTTFEVRHEDLAQVSERMDLLVISAFRGDYVPTATSLVGALARRGINVARLAADPELDLRPAVAAWVSRPTEDPSIHRVLCVESEWGLPLAERLDRMLDGLRDALAVVAVRGVEVRRVWVPLVGTGDQGLAPELVAHALVPRVRSLAESLPGVEEVAFFGHDLEKARAVSDAVDRELGRAHVTLRADELSRAVRADVRAALTPLRSRMSPPLWAELEGLLDPAREPSAVAVAACGRSVCEAVANEFARARGDGRERDLYENIQELSKAGVAQWMVQYLHTLRAIGNAAVHLRQDARVPAHLEERDLTLALFCLHRVLVFWAGCPEVPRTAER